MSTPSQTAVRLVDELVQGAKNEEFRPMGRVDAPRTALLDYIADLEADRAYGIEAGDSE